MSKQKRMNKSKPKVEILNSEMTPKQLISKVKRLSSKEIETQKFNKALGIVSPSEKAWYKHQKEHWLGWLKYSNGAGAYGRKNGHKIASMVYNRIMNPAMLFWLMEASGIPKARLKKVQKAALDSGKHCAARCPAMRKVVPWSLIEESLKKV